MKKKNNNHRLKKLYKNPLPIEFNEAYRFNNFEFVTTVKEAANVSLYYFLKIFIKSLKYRIIYKLRTFFTKSFVKENKYIDLHFENVMEKEYLIIVHGDSTQRDYLWFNGYFGKGTLSRSQPTWLFRQLAKVSAGQKENNVALEDMTRIRRQQREFFKQKRSEYESKIEDLKHKGVLNPYENLIGEYLELKKLKEDMGKQKGVLISKTVSEKQNPLAIEQDDYDTFEELIDQEDFLLSTEEYLFLKIVVSKATKSLWNTKYNLIFRPEMKLNMLVDQSQLKEMVYQFAIYSSLRNKKYIVKDGLKFGVDYIVYNKKGPVFQHAEYGILIRKIDLENAQQLRNEDILSRLRVLNSSMKKMIIVDIHSTVDNGMWLKQCKIWATLKSNSQCEEMFLALVEKCKIEQMLVKRWSVDRNRE